MTTPDQQPTNDVPPTPETPAYSPPAYGSAQDPQAAYLPPAAAPVTTMRIGVP